MQYDTEKNKHILLPIEVKNSLDKVIEDIVREKLENGNLKLRTSYADAIKYLLQK